MYVLCNKDATGFKIKAKGIEQLNFCDNAKIGNSLLIVIAYAI